MFMCGQHTRLPLLPILFRERQRQTERTELKPPPSPGVSSFPAVPHVWLAGSSRVLQAPSPSGTSSKTTLPVGRHGCQGGTTQLASLPPLSDLLISPGPCAADLGNGGEVLEPNGKWDKQESWFLWHHGTILTGGRFFRNMQVRPPSASLH